MFKEIAAYPFSRAFTDDVRSRDFAQSVFPMTTEPTGDGTFLLGEGLNSPVRVFLVPFSGSGPGTTFGLRVWGWRRVGKQNDPNLLWWPIPLVEFSCLTGNVTGASYPSGLSAIVGPGDYTCDTITVALADDGTPRGGVGLEGEIGGWSGGNASYAIVDLRGCQKMTLDPQQNNAFPVNALWALV